MVLRRTSPTNEPQSVVAVEDVNVKDRAVWDNQSVAGIEMACSPNKTDYGVPHNHFDVLDQARGGSKLVVGALLKQNYRLIKNLMGGEMNLR